MLECQNSNSKKGSHFKHSSITKVVSDVENSIRINRKNALILFWPLRMISYLNLPLGIRHDKDTST